MLEKYQKILKQRNNNSKSSSTEKSLSFENNMDRDLSVDLSKVSAGLEDGSGGE